ncbi:NAD-specific glutamate dehydrogenase [Balamuthia mandrillaris]
MSQIITTQKDLVALAEEVKRLICKDGYINAAVVDSEVDWKLGLDVSYFYQYTASFIAQHIQSIFASKMLSMVTGGEIKIDIKHETEDEAIFMCNSVPGSAQSPAMSIEEKIGRHYLATEGTYNNYRVQVYRSKGTISPDSTSQLRIYVVSRAKYALPREEMEASIETDLNKVGDLSFLKLASQWTHDAYQSILDKAVQCSGPVIEFLEPVEVKERRLIICYKRGTTGRFFASLSDLYHYHRFSARRKYIEHLANGYVIVSIYLLPMNGDFSRIDSRIARLKEEINLLYILPSTQLQCLIREKKLSVKACVYAYVAWKFAVQFLNRCGTEWYTLQTLLRRPADQENMSRYAGLLAALKSRLINDTFTEETVLDIIMESPEIVKLLYQDFSNYHLPIDEATTELVPPSPRTSKEKQPKQETAFRKKLASEIKRLPTENQQRVFEMFLAFNRHVLKTNFYKVGTTALSFRLDPSFLLKQEYKILPFGIFFIIGSTFRGFHVRFRDIARGGVRIIRSRGVQNYAQNVKLLFDENYNLALTQQKKNKDIAEGGSKGTILLNLDAQSPEQAQKAFQKYIDALLDLLLCEHDPKIVDHYGQPEIIFLGPDEGTADMMGWASQYAKQRQVPFWKALTTGKPRERGGIPHDLYGMTTHSIHQYVLGILKKAGLKEEEVKKVQTGGPDGDLGSNEIKISKDKTIAVIDGSGVLYDPEGIDREELLRLANARQMVSEFDTSKLTKEGFLVNINDRDITLPNGTMVESGLNFRNEFHLNPLCAKAQLFVPCGGRPNSVNINNVSSLYLSNKDGKAPYYKYIVEGANLFFTHDARMELEKDGVIIFKDSSANKGGVTSSSLEVLAALALSDEEFEQHMCVKDGKAPEFYEQYVKEVLATIEKNAAMEFECLWREKFGSSSASSNGISSASSASSSKKNKQTSALAVLGDMLSDKINAIKDQINGPNSYHLYANERLRSLVLRKACPPSLLKLVGLKKLEERVPETYLRSMFAAFLASHYVYHHGLKTSELSFFEFLQPMLVGAPDSQEF